MRSNLDSVIEGFETTDTLKQRQFTNYIDKAKLNERTRLRQIATRGQGWVQENRLEI